MRKLRLCTLSLALSLCAPAARAAAPTGNLDRADATTVAGWARDPDYPGPLSVHVYVDGVIVHGLGAFGLRPDLPFTDQTHGFTWPTLRLGPGSHEVRAYAIGVDSRGMPDGQNVELPNSPRRFTGNCSRMQGLELDWCNGVPSYYPRRQAETSYLLSNAVRVGVNGSYGGTIFELYGPEHTENLLFEHGGAAAQLSVWGYDDVGPAAWFASGTAGGRNVCVRTPFATEADCHAAGHPQCRPWAASRGAHVADCSTVQSCVDWGAGAPWNPIQAQGANCGWDTATNDVTVSNTSGTLQLRYDNPYHFTKSNRMPGITFEQSATLVEAGVRVDYRLRYAGTYALNEHDQELPALFPATGINEVYSFYAGGAPYTNGAVQTLTRLPHDPAGLRLALAHRDPVGGPTPLAALTEDWVTACDGSGSRCVTVASFSPLVRAWSIAAYSTLESGYLTALGRFRIVPGLDLSWSVYLFPYRYDAVVAGRSVREWIRSYAPCPSGQSQCGGGCVALATDASHCGACNHACAAGGACMGGVCTAPGCPAGFGDCDRNSANGCEVDLRGSASHCGACGAACSPGASCASGVCVGPTPPPVDASPPPVDAAALPEGGPLFDASSEVGALRDGALPASDGAPRDAAYRPPPPPPSCGCRAGPSPSERALPGLLAGLTLAWLRRQRRRQKP